MHDITIVLLNILTTYTSLFIHFFEILPLGSKNHHYHNHGQEIAKHYPKEVLRQLNILKESLLLLEIPIEDYIFLLRPIETQTNIQIRLILNVSIQKEKEEGLDLVVQLNKEVDDDKDFEFEELVQKEFNINKNQLIPVKAFP